MTDGTDSKKAEPKKAEARTTEDAELTQDELDGVHGGSSFRGLIYTEGS